MYFVDPNLDRIHENVLALSSYKINVFKNVRLGFAVKIRSAKAILRLNCFIRFFFSICNCYLSEKTEQYKSRRISLTR